MHMYLGCVLMVLPDTLCCHGNQHIPSLPRKRLQSPGPVEGCGDTEGGVHEFLDHCLLDARTCMSHGQPVCVCVCEYTH